MPHTEDEARQKWCPFARVARREDIDPARPGMAVLGGTNRDSFGRLLNPASCRCLASECMAWRWVGYLPVNGGKNDEAHGCCGLAGKPIDA